MPPTPDVHWQWLGFGSSVAPNVRFGACLNPQNRVAIVRGRDLAEAEAEAWRLGIHPMWDKTWAEPITDREMQQIPAWARERLLGGRELTQWSWVIRAQRGGSW